MKNTILILFLLLTVKVAGQSQSRKVLFLGNSYIYVNDLPQIVTALAENTGDVLIYDSNSIGGYTLENHFSSTVSKNKILSDDWDYIVLQEQSQRPAFSNPSGFLNGFGNLKNFIKQNKPCAQITSFMTWGYANGDTQNCPTNPNVCTYEGMQNLLTDRYINISGIYESEVTPVGVVWKYIRENHPAINLYQPDGSHPSLAGSYIAACCFYTSIFRKDPAQISTDYGLDANTATIIRNATKTLVFDQMPDWYIGKYVPNSNFNYRIGNGLNQIILSNPSQFQDAFRWDFGDGTTATNTNPVHSYATDGNFTIKLTSYKCYLGQNLESTFERTVNFCAHTNTIFPNLLLCPNETGTFWTQPADSYQWYDDFGNPISGATQQSLQVVAGLSYSVFTTRNGCSEMSPQVLVDMYQGNPNCTLNLTDTEKNIAISFVNPVGNLLDIQTQKWISEVAVYDLSGKKITVNQVSPHTFDVSRLAQGIYILKVNLENRKVISSKFIKQ